METAMNRKCILLIILVFLIYVQTYAAAISFSKGGSGDGSIKVDGELHSLPFSASYPTGTTIIVEAVPTATSEFINWAWLNTFPNRYYTENPRAFTAGVNNLSYQVNFEPVSFTILDAWWQAIQDDDCDGIPRRKTLLLNLLVSAAGTIRVRVHVGNSIIISDTDVQSGITTLATGYSVHEAGTYDVPLVVDRKMAEWNYVAVASRTPGDDPDLYQQQMEPTESGPTMTLNGYRWSDPVDQDHDGYFRARPISFDITLKDFYCPSYPVYVQATYHPHDGQTNMEWVDSNTSTFTSSQPSQTLDAVVDQHQRFTIGFGEWDFRLSVFAGPLFICSPAEYDYQVNPGLTAQKFELDDQDKTPAECSTMEWATPPTRVDQDGDGYRSKDLLRLSTGSWSDCYYKLYYKPASQTTYSFYAQTKHLVLDPNATFSLNLGNPNLELPHGVYDLKLELYNTHTDYLVHTYDETTDPQLNDQKFEQENQDPTTAGHSANVWVLTDGDPDFTNPPFADSLMAFASNGEKLMTLDGFNIAQTIGGARSLAVADDGQSCWVCENTGNILSKIDWTGKILLRIPAKIAAVDLDTKANLYALTHTYTIYGDSIVVFDANGNLTMGAHYGGYDLVVDDDHSAVWIVGGDITKLDLNMHHQFTVDPIAWTATTVDYASDGTIWVGEGKHPDVPGSKDRLIHLDDKGSILDTIDLSYRPMCIRTDRSDGSIWIVSDALYKYVPGHSQLIKMDPVAGYALSIDPCDNLIWVATYKDVRSYSQSGELKTILTGLSQNTQKFIATRKEHSNSQYTLTITQSGLGTGWVKVNNILRRLPYTEQAKSGTAFALEAVPKNYSSFAGWSGANASINTSPVISFILDSDKNLNTAFNLAPFYSNLLINGDFSDGANNWWFGAWPPAEANGSVLDGEYFLECSQVGDYAWQIQLIQTGLLIENGSTYHVLFDAYAPAVRFINPWVGKDGPPWSTYGGTHTDTLSTARRRYDYSFTMAYPSDPVSRLLFDLGLSMISLYLDNIVLIKEINTNATVTFTAQVPGDIPPADILYLAGNFNFWDPGPGQNGSDNQDHDLPMQKVSSNTWQITLPFIDGIQLEYKYTRGSWGLVEKGSHGEEIENRKLTVPLGPSQQNDTVYGWVDLLSVNPTTLVPVHTFQLMDNYPNPFNNETRIQYELPYDCQVNLTILDLMGHEVRALVKGDMTQGTHEISFSAGDLPNGVYFYRLVATSADGKRYHLAKKLILMK
jgi:hypothetical protein